jgi:hypothetical protein
MMLRFFLFRCFQVFLKERFLPVCTVTILGNRSSICRPTNPKSSMPSCSVCALLFAGLWILNACYMLCCSVWIVWSILAWINGVGFPDEYFIIKLCSRYTMQDTIVWNVRENKIWKKVSIMFYCNWRDSVTRWWLGWTMD